MAEISPFASSNESGQSRTTIRDLQTGTVTLLFSDIEGSTHLLQQVGERYAELLATCQQLLRTAFQQWNGVEVMKRTLHRSICMRFTHALVS